jgi:hypothetical protein
VKPWVQMADDDLSAAGGSMVSPAKQTKASQQVGCASWAGERAWALGPGLLAGLSVVAGLSDRADGQRRARERGYAEGTVQ